MIDQAHLNKAIVSFFACNSARVLSGCSADARFGERLLCSRHLLQGTNKWISKGVPRGRNGAYLWNELQERYGGNLAFSALQSASLPHPHHTVKSSRPVHRPVFL